jgi:hypothetical protein
MSAEIQADVYRVTVRAALKKTLVEALRDPRARLRRPRPQPLRNPDGGYSAVLFVPTPVKAWLTTLEGLQIVESTNITARLRQGPLSAADAGLETTGYSAGPMTRTDKAAPLSPT